MATTFTNSAALNAAVERTRDAYIPELAVQAVELQRVLDLIMRTPTAWLDSSGDPKHGAALTAQLAALAAADTRITTAAAAVAAMNVLVQAAFT